MFSALGGSRWALLLGSALSRAAAPFPRAGPGLCRCAYRDAKVSGTAALLPSYLASTWGFREGLCAPRTFHGRRVALSMAGGAAGTCLLLVTPKGDVSGHRALAAARRDPAVRRRAGPVAPAQPRRGRGAGLVQGATLFAISIYGGYFNGGLGIVLHAALGLLGHIDINAMNGLKNLIWAVLTAVAVGLSALGGHGPRRSA